MTSHIEALNRYERSTHGMLFADLPLAAQALRYKREEARAGAELDEMGHTGRLLWPDHYDATSDEYHTARKGRTAVILSYLRERGERPNSIGEAA
jgi:hypothetical protein